MWGGTGSTDDDDGRSARGGRLVASRAFVQMPRSGGAQRHEDKSNTKGRSHLQTRLFPVELLALS